MFFSSNSNDDMSMLHPSRIDTSSSPYLAHNPPETIRRIEYLLGRKSRYIEGNKLLGKLPNDLVPLGDDTNGGVVWWRPNSYSNEDMEMADSVFSGGGNLLVTGPSGSGKTWFVSAIARNMSYSDDFKPIYVYGSPSVPVVDSANDMDISDYSSGTVKRVYDVMYGRYSVLRERASDIGVQGFNSLPSSEFDDIWSGKRILLILDDFGNARIDEETRRLIMQIVRIGPSAGIYVVMVSQSEYDSRVSGLLLYFDVHVKMLNGYTGNIGSNKATVIRPTKGTFIIDNVKSSSYDGTCRVGLAFSPKRLGGRDIPRPCSPETYRKLTEIVRDTEHEANWRHGEGVYTGTYKGVTYKSVDSPDGYSLPTPDIPDSSEANRTDHNAGADDGDTVVSDADLSHDDGVRNGAFDSETTDTTSDTDSDEYDDGPDYDRWIARIVLIGSALAVIADIVYRVFMVHGMKKLLKRK